VLTVAFVVGATGLLKTTEPGPEAFDQARVGVVSSVTVAPTEMGCPAVPETLEDLGLSQSFVTDLVLRRLLLEGFSSLSSLSNTLKLSVSIIDIVFKHLRAQQLIEVKGMIGND
jgi:hypothetical protein